MGLVQRAIEEAGLSTVTLSCVADLTQSVGVPRLAALEHPLGQPFGKPGDVQTQQAVLTHALDAFTQITAPGGRVDLPFRWAGPRGQAMRHPDPPPPIVAYLKTHPWQLPKFYRRQVP